MLHYCYISQGPAFCILPPEPRSTIIMKEGNSLKLIDLHVHSTASDGSYTPAEVTALAVRAGLTAIALTDHDTVSGVGEALDAAGDTALEVVPGVELSCLYKEKEIHILGLYIDYTDKNFLDFLNAAEIKRNSRNQLMLEAFQKDGFPIAWDDLLMGNPETVVTRAHFARALVKKGCVASVDQAFKKYLNPDCPYYRKREIITPGEAVQAIRDAGGFPVLAHPCLYKLGWMQTGELIRTMKELGLGGLECWHSSNYAEESSKLCRLADQYGLLPTGGSDFHGAAKPDIQLGKGRGSLRVPAEYLDALKLAMFLGR